MSLNNTQTETDLVIYRDNKLDSDYKRRVAIKKTKQAMKLIGAATADFARYLLIDPLKRAGAEIATEIRLGAFDFIYGTHLKAQRESGLRTQRILAAKRTYGLN